MKRVVDIDWVMAEKSHDGLMFMDWEGFGEKISEVVCTLTPNDTELQLGHTVTDPMKSHVDGLRLL